MKRRLFIAINLPEGDKNRINKLIAKWQDLPVVWSRTDNFHLTLLFLGYVDDENLLDLCEKIKNVTGQFQSLDVEFNQVGFGPDDDDPKMIWLKGEANENLQRLQESLEKELGFYSHSRREYRPHITLGRIRRGRWSKLSEQPQINQKFMLSFPASSLDLMESTFEDGRRVYTLLESNELNS
jgi:2'-5' RNA ligase